MSIQPIINAPYLCQFGGNLSYNSTTLLNITAGQFRDSTNTYDIVVPSNVILNTAVIGLNGVSATLAASSLYSVYAITSSQGFLPSGYLLDLTVNPLTDAPSLPTGYDVYRRIGFVNIDSSSHIIKFSQTGNQDVRTYSWATPISVLSSGNATSATDISLYAAVPPVSTCIVASFTYTPHTVSNVATIYNSVADTAIFTLNSTVVSVPTSGQFTCHVTPATISSVYTASLGYSVTESDDTLDIQVMSFTDYI